MSNLTRITITLPDAATEKALKRAALEADTTVSKLLEPEVTRIAAPYKDTWPAQSKSSRFGGNRRKGDKV